MSNFRDYKLEEDKEYITIELEEYKELLMIKGKYEELKNMYMPSYPKTSITYRGLETFKSPYTVTCGNYDGETYTSGYCAIEEENNK